MKINELIEKLEEIQQEHGNLYVTFTDGTLLCNVEVEVSGDTLYAEDSLFVRVS